MPVQYFNNWELFSISFGIVLVISFIMLLQSRNFYTFYVTKRRFSIMELEIPATATELARIIKGLFDLPEDESKKSIAALKGQLKLDFLFMPFTYGSIFLLCLRVSEKLQSGIHLGYYVFFAFAILQIIPWVCDIIENIYLLKKIRQGNDVKASTDKQHKAYLIMEAFKWGLSLTATVCSISAICYFWLSGNYSVTSFKYLLIILVEIIAFIVVTKKFGSKKSS